MLFWGDHGVFAAELFSDLLCEQVEHGLMGKMSREAQKEGVTTLEAQAAEDNAPLVALLKSMRWNIVERGEVFRKNLA